jgi:hypothetical protein
LRFFAAAADVGGKPELLAQVAHLGVVVATVEAQPLRPLPGRLRTLDRDRLERDTAELEVV